jgi:hypothetical protein
MPDALAHAKGERRYRYYVSRSLTKGVDSETHGAWRLAAAEMERIVAAAAKSILEDKPLIVGAIEEAEIASSPIPRFSTPPHVARLQSEAERGPALASLVDCVELAPLRPHPANPRVLVAGGYAGQRRCTQRTRRRTPRPLHRKESAPPPLPFDWLDLLSYLHFNATSATDPSLRLHRP